MQLIIKTENFATVVKQVTDNLIEKYMLELFIINFIPYLVFSGLNWMSFQRLQEKVVTDPFGRISIRQATQQDLI